MRIKINSYKEIKALSIVNGIKMEKVALELGYTSIWGLKMALKNDNKKDSILDKAKMFFKN